LFFLSTSSIKIFGFSRDTIAFGTLSRANRSPLLSWAYNNCSTTVLAHPVRCAIALYSCSTFSLYWSWREDGYIGD